jgi:hypothetical protein
MPIHLRWIANVSTSCLHAADAWVRSKSLADPRLTQAFVDSAAELQDEILRSPLPPGRFWRQLLTWAHQYDNNRELASMAIRKTVRWEPQYEALTGRIADQIGRLESTVQRAIPEMLDELEMRSRPIREQWESRGPGLLHRVAQLTDERLIVENADVVLVLPALGGGGGAHLQNNSVRIEAVLTNNVLLLPEVVRLGWLLAQLNADLPVLSETLTHDRLPTLAQLAMLPAVLQAAQEVELTELNLQTLSSAIIAWHVEALPGSAAAESLLLWWQTYLETRPEWKTAMAALEKMVFG